MRPLSKTTFPCDDATNGQDLALHGLERAALKRLQQLPATLRTHAFSEAVRSHLHTLGFIESDHWYSRWSDLDLSMTEISTDIPRSEIQTFLETAEALSTTKLFSLAEYLQEEERGKRGVFYTTPLLAHHTVSSALQNLDLTQFTKPRMLDPSCGSGVFLATLFEAPALKEIPPLERIHLLHGIDLHPLSVCLTRWLVLALVRKALGCGPPEWVYELVQQQITCEDGLSPKRKNSAAGTGKACLIIGNPPYGLRRNELNSPQYTAELKNLFPHLGSAVHNLYMVFMGLYSEEIAPDGVMSFIVPNSWTAIRAAKSLRTCLLSQGGTHSIQSFEERLFSDASVETVLYTFSKTSSTSESIALTSFSSPCTEPLSSSSVSIRRVTSAPHVPIPLVWNNEVESLLSLIEKDSVPLIESGLGIPRIALQAYATGKGTPPQTKEMVKEHVYHHRERITEADIPYLAGKDVGRFQLEWSGRFLTHGKHLAEPQRLELFTGPRILLREILGTPPHLVRATFTDKPYLYNKSVLHILPAPESSEEILLGLLGLLTSAIGSFLIAAQGQKSQRGLFPKLLAADLKRFPVPRNPERLLEVAEIVPSLLHTTNNTENDSALNHRLNVAAANAYSLPKTSINSVLDAIKFMVR